MQVTEKTIRRWIAAGTIKRAAKVTSRSGWRIPQSEVERLLRESS